MEVHAEGQLAHFNLGLAFRQKGYYGEALREYAKALERGEDRPLVLQAMAEVHLLRREAKAAVELYDELLAQQPDSPKLWNERGVALHQDGKFAEAEESYRRAVQAELGLRARAQQPRRGALPSRRRARRRSPRSASRSTRSRRSPRRGSTSRCC